VKSFFDFIGRTEATRGARRWSWTILEVDFSLYPRIKKATSVKLVAIWSLVGSNRQDQLQDRVIVKRTDDEWSHRPSKADLDFRSL
jgi:hypothetical protein